MNPAMLGEATDALAFGKGSAPKKGKLHMKIHEMDDKKFHVEHEMRGGSEPDGGRKEYAAGNIKELHDHIDRHYGGDSANLKGSASDWEKDRPSDKEGQPKGEQKEADGA